MSIFNVLNAGPNAAANVQQPDYRNPVVNANVANYAVGADILQAQPIPTYTQGGTTAKAIPDSQLADPMGES
jgi:hypothetical protein